MEEDDATELLAPLTPDCAAVQLKVAPTVVKFMAVV
jgi:hypothetical protein